MHLENVLNFCGDFKHPLIPGETTLRPQEADLKEYERVGGVLPSREDPWALTFRGHRLHVGPTSATLDQYAREKEGRDNGATQTLAQVFS